MEIPEGNLESIPGEISVRPPGKPLQKSQSEFLKKYLKKPLAVMYRKKLYESF